MTATDSAALHLWVYSPSINDSLSAPLFPLLRAAPHSSASSAAPSPSKHHTPCPPPSPLPISAFLSVAGAPVAALASYAFEHSCGHKQFVEVRPGKPFEVSFLVGPAAVGRGGWDVLAEAFVDGRR